MPIFNVKNNQSTYRCPLCKNPSTCTCSSCHMQRERSNSLATLRAAEAKNFAVTSSTIPSPQAILATQPPKKNINERLTEQRRKNLKANDKAFANAQLRSTKERIESVLNNGLSGRGSKAAAKSYESYIDNSLKLLGYTREEFFKSLPTGPNENFYRGDTYPLNLPTTYEDLDTRLGDIIKHTSRTSGSAGQVQSFTSNIHVASRFARARGGELMTVHASEGLFKSAGDILLTHGDRLVKAGHIQGGTLKKAIENYFSCQESEYFWLGKY